MTDMSMLASDWLPYPLLQIPGAILLIGLIIFWVLYRRKQM